MIPLNFLLLFDVLVSLCGGAFLLWKGLSLTSDKAWKKHVERSAARGLHPERNAYWERSARRGRIIQVLDGTLDDSVELGNRRIAPDQEAAPDVW